MFNLQACCSFEIVWPRLYPPLFSRYQAALTTLLSVRPSVCYTFFKMFLSLYHHESFRSDCQWQKLVHAKGQGQRSKVKTKFSRFRTVTPVCNNIQWWNDAQGLMLLGRGALLFLAATKQLYKWYFPSVCPSVCPSHLFDYVPIIGSSWNFQELLPMTNVRSMQKVKVEGQGHRGHNPT